MVQLYEPVIKSCEGYYQRYGLRVPSLTIYLAHQKRMTEEEAYED
jgi:hypothetical protein